jgi:hypothetical protein
METSMGKQKNSKVTVQPHVWDKAAGRYVATEHSVATDLAQLEQLKISAMSVTRRFLKGPIPWNWVIRASQLPGNALAVGLCLWRLKGATKRTDIELGNSEVEPFGIDRSGKSRALAELERAGLIKLQRKPGRWATITLLEN